MSTLTPPPPPRPTITPTVVRVVEPTIGGKIEYNYKETAWTGGKPNYDWTGHETVTTMKTPMCYRQPNPEYEAKAFRKQTEPRLEDKKFEKDLAEPTLSAFAKRVKNHMEVNGMDSIFFIQDPTRPRKMISVLENYQLVTMAHVHAEGKRITPLFNEYDKKIARQPLNTSVPAMDPRC